MTQHTKSTRQALLDAACQLFADHGFDAVSTRMIADAAQVNLGGIHYHFGSKEQLYVAAFQHAAITENQLSLGDVATQHPELMETPEGQAKIIRITTREMFSDCFNPDAVGWKKRIVLHELCSPSSAMPILVREVFKSSVEGDIDFLRRISPDQPQEIMAAWVNMMHAQIMFYMLTQNCQELVHGPEIAGQTLFTEAARQAANALILLLGLPLEQGADHN